MKEESKGNNFPLNPYRSCLEQGGTQRTLVDAAGQPLYAWDAEDRKTEIIYDELRRPLKRIANDKELERYIYGEGLVNDKVNNLRGQLYQHYDGSGLQQINIYDFKGNALETQQQLLEDATISDAYWSSNPVLSVEAFTSAITYDALNRPITQTDPGGNVQTFIYDKGGFLESLKLNNENYVNDIHYDAKGQRQAIWYGNGTKTSYTYDAFTFRLRRLLTVNLNDNKILQDLNYWYDLVGNITEVQDDAQQTLFFNNSVVSPTQKFTYDAIYRLIEARGRELIGTANFGSEDNWNDAAWQTSHKEDGNAVQNYTQKYTYDEVGNILSLQHVAGVGSYTRMYDIDTESNRMLGNTVGADSYSYAHDVRGNMTTMPHLDALFWNLNSELHKIENGTMEAYYQYSGGQRVHKYVDKGSIKEDRIYLGNFEIYRRYVNNVLDIERTTVHVSDDTGRIAMLEVRTVGTDPSPEELTRYIYSNHLQSASLELDETGAIISYEEYHPYGTTSYQSINAIINAVAKRYRYTGKERNKENGFYYHGARYYVPWLARWVSVDPINSENYNLQKSYGIEKNKERDFLELTASPYEYCYDNPINYNDLNGEQPPVKEIKTIEEQGGNDKQNLKNVSNQKQSLNNEQEPNELSTKIISFEDVKKFGQGRKVYGVSLKLIYTADVSEYEQLEWIQNVTTSSPKSVNPSGRPYLDMGGNSETQRYPFYFPKDVLDIVSSRGDLYGGLWFQDAPQRYIGTYVDKDFYFMAETSLIGKKDGKWEHIATYGWGFSVKDGREIIKTPIIYSEHPSKFNRDIITNLNK